MQSQVFRYIKPLSAIMVSPGSTRYRKPLLFRYLSETPPPHRWEIKEIDPEELIAIKNFTVLCFLYSLNVSFHVLEEKMAFQLKLLNSLCEWVSFSKYLRHTFLDNFF